MNPLRFIIQFVLTNAFLSSAACGATCIAPARPFVPTDRNAVFEYRDLIQQNFESYIASVQQYFHCIDQERIRAFAEAHSVVEQYRNFLHEFDR